MNISFFNNISTNFKGSYTDRFFDNPEDIREDHRIIREYEGIPEKNEEDTIFVNDMLREDELFDRRRDFVNSGYRKYDADDLPLSQNIIYRNLNKDLVNKSQFIESGHSSSRGLSWNPVPSIPFYTVDSSNTREHESFQDRLNQGYKRSDISNIYHFALIDTPIPSKKGMDFNLVKAGFQLLDSGKSIYQTADIMDKSKVHYANGSTRFNPDLLEFLQQYPDDRSIVVENRGNYERVRSDIMSIYPELNKICPEREDKERVIRVCQTGESKNKKIDEKLFDICKTKLSAGESVKEFTKNFRASLLEQPDGSENFSEELYNFLAKYPGNRDIVVDYHNRSEHFRDDIAELFPKVKKACKNEKAIKSVIESCEIGDYAHRTVDKNLFKLSMKLLEKNSQWGNNHAKIMGAVVRENRYSERAINQQKYELAESMAQGDYSVPAIYSVVVLNHKNPELCK